MKLQKDRSIRESVAFVFQETLNNDKLILFFSLLRVPFRVFDRLADIYLVALIVDSAMRSAEARLVYIILFYALYKLLSELLTRYSDWQLSTRNYRSKMKFTSKFAAKYMRTDFAVIESTEGKDLAQRAKNSMTSVDYRDKSAVESFFQQCAALIGDFCGLFVYAGIITILNPWIIVMLLLTSSVGYLLQKTLVRYDQRDKTRYIPVDRKLWYLVKEMRDLGSAKDIRLYGLMGWLRKLFENNLAARMKLHTKRSRYQYLFLVIINIINTVFTGYIYYYLILQYLSGCIDISQFLLYFGLITGFNTWLMSITGGFEELHRTVLNIDDLRRFQRIPDHLEASDSNTTADLDNSIRFEKVSFGYQEGKYVIKDMNVIY